MISLNNIHSVTEFQRNPKGILGLLKSSKSPLVLTVNGKAELVVQDAASYQKLLDKVESARPLCVGARNSEIGFGIAPLASRQAS